MQCLILERDWQHDVEFDLDVIVGGYRGDAHGEKIGTVLFDKACDLSRIFGSRVMLLRQLAGHDLSLDDAVTHCDGEPTHGRIFG